MPVASDCGIAGHNGTLCSSGLEVGPRLLHLPLPIAFGLGSDANGVESEPHFHGPASLGTQAVIFRPTNVVSEAELRDGVGDSL